MIIAAAACAAAGISYIFNDNEPSKNSKSELVTISSTIIDKQGIVKYVIPSRILNPYLFIHSEQKGIDLLINKSRLNQLKFPIENNQLKNHLNFHQTLSIVFFWSIPLKSRLLQIPTKSCLIIENFNPFEKHLMKISIGTQNLHPEIVSNPSEIALSYSDEYSHNTNEENHLGNDTLDSLSYNRNIIPIGILKKKKLDMNEKETDQKRFCFDSNEENRMRNLILNNVNLCVENLSKILSESCSNTEQELTTLHKTSSIISLINKNHNYNKQISNSFKHEEYPNSDEFYLNYENNHLIERLSDGIILHRGEQFGRALGEPMIRKDKKNENVSFNSFHSIDELNRLLSKTNCLLMRQYNIESIEDLIRLFLEYGQVNFTKLLIDSFKVNSSTVEQLNTILLNWSRKLT